MAVSLRIIKLTREIDEGSYQAYEQLKALARTDPDVKRVLKTVKEPKSPSPGRSRSHLFRSLTPRSRQPRRRGPGTLRPSLS